MLPRMSISRPPWSPTDRVVIRGIDDEIDVLVMVVEGKAYQQKEWIVDADPLGDPDILTDRDGRWCYLGGVVPMRWIKI